MSKLINGTFLSNGSVVLWSYVMMPYDRPKLNVAGLMDKILLVRNQAKHSNVLENLDNSFIYHQIALVNPSSLPQGYFK